MWFHELHDSYNQLFPLCFKWQKAYTQIHGLLQLDFLYLRFCCCSVTRSCPTLWPHWLQLARLPCPSLSPGVCSNSYPLSRDAIQPSHPLWSPSPPALNLSWHQGLFQWVNSLHQVAKILEFQLIISPSNEHPGLISFRMDWLDLLAVQGTLKSLLQHHSSKASILQCSAFFTVQLSHPYMTTGKTIALTRLSFPR